MINKIQYNASNDPRRIAGETDSFCSVEQWKTEQSSNGEAKTCKRNPSQEINVTKNVKY